MCDADDCSMFYFLLLCSISPSTYLCQFTIWSHVLGIHLSMCLIARQQAWLSMLSVRYVPFPYLSGKFVTKCDLSSPLCIVVWLCLMLYRLVTLVIFFFLVPTCCDVQRPEWGTTTSSTPSMRDCILLAACGALETLPQNSELPADVFTSCLTTPIQIALRW